ncbi:MULTISPECIES: replication endonuclease [Pseudoalteromonas]|uniref:replication endonuclease n=1 Tax=Pseudoalteromonas TaxID=53246 RepID=UPI0002CC6C58|nr:MULTISPECIES: replication endonuclease [Pseudoalteromonas]ENN98986.1 replication gene A protein [Pseudoalteromonas agarivorans S816]TMS65659.1 replication endonuclease [Pseudoalteromonas sp. S1691]TMS66010.1 replication endonuclease [Pseudoalteromonas sp. S1731]TMS71129.1 replication endonuclease [Pseudoalteromonas sp. S1941]TMS76171.1 replication endonuclease [Pseudoalteromonas sp. S1690]
MANPKPLDLQALRLSGIAKGLISSISDIDDRNFLARGLQNVPVPLQSRMARKYIDRYNQKKAGSQYRANTWLRRTIARLKPRFGVLFSITQNMPLPWHILSSIEKTKKHAGTLAMECVKITLDVSEENQHLPYEKIISLTYDAIATHAKTVGANVPFYAMRDDNLPTECYEIALLKMQCDRWWARQLKTIRRQFLELLEIATGQVGKDLYHDKKSKKFKRRGISPYSSKQAQREFNFAQASGRQFLEMMELQSSEGDVISLIEAVKSGMANPANRRNELMLRIRETEELADEMGYVGVFYTITCPSRFHANSSKWHGETPKDAQNYLTQTWARARSKLNRRGLKYFGVRVVEPHADGCPHWHMMLFMPKNKLQEVNAILRWYFIQEDKTELYDYYGPVQTRAKVVNEWVDINTHGTHIKTVEKCVSYRAGTKKSELFKTYKQKRREWGLKKSQGKKAKAPSKFYRTFSPRFDAIKMDKSKGSAASYIAKYISKNIDGYQLSDHEDAETGENLQEQANPVLAWASTWNIRQFQFQGSPSVTVYRELRRMPKGKAISDETIEPIRHAADTANWKDYVKLQGGMCIGRAANFKSMYEDTQMGNDYAEVVRRIKGVLTNTDYKAVLKRTLENVHNVITQTSLKTRLVEWTRQLKGTAEKLNAKDNTNVGVADLSWTSGNNCTPIAAGSRAELLLDMMGTSENDVDEVIKDLNSGKRISRNGQIYQIRDGQLQVLNVDEQIKHDQLLAIESLAKTYSQKAGSWHITEAHWQQAREYVELAYKYAQLDGRNTPNNTHIQNGLVTIGDWDLVTLVKQGCASAISDNDWWALDMMA